LLFGQLNARYPALNWTKIFPDVGPNKTVVITDANFFYGLDRIIGQTNTDTVKIFWSSLKRDI
jgi:predicted metalloendopeptidase